MYSKFIAFGQEAQFQPEVHSKRIESPVLSGGRGIGRAIAGYFSRAGVNHRSLV
jgi:hypothetical protein